MDIKNEILNYISATDMNGALLLTGKWGCGKTFFINSFSEEINLKEECAVIRISLFGINSISELHKLVKRKVANHVIFHGNETVTASKIRDTGKSITSVFSNVSKTAKNINAVLQIDPFDFMDVQAKMKCRGKKSVSVNKQIILIFDDLERCSIEIINLLGALNEYVEEKK